MGFSNPDKNIQRHKRGYDLLSSPSAPHLSQCCLILWKPSVMLITAPKMCTFRLLTSHCTSGITPSVVHNLMSSHRVPLLPAQLHLPLLFTKKEANVPSSLVTSLRVHTREAEPGRQLGSFDSKAGLTAKTKVGPSGALEMGSHFYGAQPGGFFKGLLLQ